MVEINLLIRIGPGNNYRTIDISIIHSLSSLHVISVCDVASAFLSIGKVNWLSTVQKKMENLNALGLLGETLEVENAVLNTTDRLTCGLYSMQTESDVNVARNKEVLSRENAGSTAITAMNCIHM